MGILDGADGTDGAGDPAASAAPGGGRGGLVFALLVVAALVAGFLLRGFWSASPLVPSASGTEGAAVAAVPIGGLVAFGGAVERVPDGWLACDGRPVERARYPELFAAIGTAHGAGDGATTFCLPDLRGRFVRGVDGGSGRDPDRAERATAADGGNSGDAVGSVQDDAVAAHEHGYDRFKLKDVDWQRGVKHYGNGTGDVDSGRTARAGADETRPRNVAVNWLIRAR